MQNRNYYKENQDMETKNEKSGIIKTILIIVAVVLVVFICWKAGWILNGNKNEVSEHEKQEAIQEANDELNSEIQELNDELRDAQNELRDELHDALQ